MKHFENSDFKQNNKNSRKILNKTGENGRITPIVVLKKVSISLPLLTALPRQKFRAENLVICRYQLRFKVTVGANRN